MLIRADISLYPLATPDLAPVIFDFVRRVEAQGVAVETGAMSSTLAGEARDVFEALRLAYEGIAAQHRAALVIKIIAVGKPGTPD